MIDAACGWVEPVATPIALPQLRPRALCTEHATDVPVGHSVSLHSLHDDVGPSAFIGNTELTRLAEQTWVSTMRGRVETRMGAVFSGERVFKLHVELAGGQLFGFGRERGYALRPGVIATLAQHETVAKWQWVDRTRERASITLLFLQEIIGSLLEDGMVPANLGPWLDAAGGPPLLDGRIAPAAVIQAAWQMVDCPFTGKVRRAWLESKAMEILCLWVGMGQHASARMVPDGYSRRDRDRLAQARDILLAHLTDPPSLDALSRAVALNRRKLTEGFKAAYGQTVFGFVQDQRLELARTLLRDGGRSVAEAASLVGYGHPTSFTAAYRRKFGRAPSEEPA